MTRVFGHYVSIKTGLLVILETLILGFSAYVGFSIESTIHGVQPAISLKLAVYPLAMLILVSGMGLYHSHIWEELGAIRKRTIAMLVFGFLAALAVSYVLPGEHQDSDALSVILLTGLAGTALLRFTFYQWGNVSAFKERVLVLGTGSRVMKLEQHAQRSHAYEVVGYVAPSAGTHFVPDSKVITLGEGESLASVVEKLKVDRIVMAIRERRGTQLPVQELLACRLNGVKVTELSTFFEREYRQVLLESLNPSWIMFGDGYSVGNWRMGVKRAFDLVASSILLLLTLPVMLITALMIVLEDGAGVFYRQERVGQGGRSFWIYKFRSMGNDAEKDGKPRWASANDDRTTRVGRVIRKLRIDELPQIINVFKGEMSFVGPRPERPFFVNDLVADVPYYKLRHCVKPGITGWAQVNYPYGSTMDDTIEKLQYDLYYLKNHGLFLDLVILLATVEVVLWGKGAR